MEPDATEKYPELTSGSNLPTHTFAIMLLPHLISNAGSSGTAWTVRGRITEIRIHTTNAAIRADGTRPPLSPVFSISPIVSRLLVIVVVIGLVDHEGPRVRGAVVRPQVVRGRTRTCGRPSEQDRPTHGLVILLVIPTSPSPVAVIVVVAVLVIVPCSAGPVPRPVPVVIFIIIVVVVIVVVPDVHHPVPRARARRQARSQLCPCVRVVVVRPRLVVRDLRRNRADAAEQDRPPGAGGVHHDEEPSGRGPRPGKEEGPRVAVIVVGPRVAPALAAECASEHDDSIMGRVVHHARVHATGGTHEGMHLRPGVRVVVVGPRVQPEGVRSGAAPEEDDPVRLRVVRRANEDPAGRSWRGEQGVHVRPAILLGIVRPRLPVLVHTHTFP